MKNCIPKSLHTVTVIVKLARHFAAATITDGKFGMVPADCVATAVEFLGYTGTPDDHALASAAVKILSK